jgi:hypothetical protein
MVMAEKREITLTEENWKKIDELLEKIPDSEFLRFCLMNDIVEEGIRLCLKKYFKTET